MAKSTSSSILTFMKSKRKVIPYVIFGFSLLLYANTLGHEFTQDDAIAIYQNQFTKEGFAGLYDIFTKDTFHGFFGGDKSDLVSGGRYRPLTFAYFAILWQLFGDNPFPFHLSNILMYAGLCVLLYFLLLRLKLFKSKSHNIFWAAASALIYSAHPIHTEAVANVKGLDEIWSLGFGLLATLLSLKYVDSKSIKDLLLSGICLFLGILSKENAIAFIGLIPITILFFRKTRWSLNFKILGMLGIVTGIYAVLRVSVIGFNFGEPPLEMMNNPFMKVVDGVYYSFTSSEKWATIFYGLGKYIGLLFFPHPLTHDYYPRHFEVMSFSDPTVILSMVMMITVVGFALIDFRKKNIISYSSIFFLAGIALTCNIVFPIGTHLSERFLFMPSVGYALLVSSFILYLLKKNEKFGVALWIILLILFSVKTISRNQVWKDDFTLFTTDVHTSPNSAKVQNAAGGAMVTKANEIDDEQEQTRLRNQAKVHLSKSIQIHPSYKNAYLLLGNAHFGLNEYDDAIKNYEKAIQLDHGYQAANDNLVLAYREGARFEGSQRGNIQKAINWLFKADVLSPGDYETISLLGIAHGNSNQHEKALIYFKKALELRPNNPQAHRNLASVYANMNNEELKNFHLQKAEQLK